MQIYRIKPQYLKYSSICYFIINIREFLSIFPAPNPRMYSSINVNLLLIGEKLKEPTV